MRRFRLRYQKDGAGVGLSIYAQCKQERIYQQVKYFQSTVAHIHIDVSVVMALEVIPIHIIHLDIIPLLGDKALYVVV